MTYSIHGSAADSLIPQFGTQEQISEAIGGDYDESRDVALLLNDPGNQHALVIEGSGEALKGWFDRLGAVLAEAFPDSFDPLALPERIEHGAFDDLLVNIETACRNRRAILVASGTPIDGDDAASPALPQPAQKVVDECVAEAWRNTEQNDATTEADVATDVAQRLFHIYRVHAWDDGQGDGPVADPNAGYDVQALKNLAYGKVDEGTEPLELDDAVHEVASRIGSDANNGGIDDQVDFLVEHLGYFAAHTLIHDRNRQQR